MAGLGLNGTFVRVEPGCGAASRAGVWAGGGESLEAENKDALTWQRVAQDTEGWRYLETFFVWDIDWKLEAKGRPGQRKQ